MEALRRQRERHEREKEESGGGEEKEPRKIAGFVFDAESGKYFPESEMIRRRKKKKKEEDQVVVNLMSTMSTMNLRSRSITRSIMSRRMSCKQELKTAARIRALRENKRSFHSCVNMDVVRCNETGGKFSAIAGLNYSTRIMLSQFKEEKCVGQTSKWLFLW